MCECVCEGGGGGGRGEGKGGEGSGEERTYAGGLTALVFAALNFGLLVFLVNFSTNFEFNVHNFPQRRCNDH